MTKKEIWKSKAVKTVLLSILSLIFLIIAVLGITFWLLLYLDSITPDNIDYDNSEKEEGFYDMQNPSSFYF